MRVIFLTGIDEYLALGIEKSVPWSLEIADLYEHKAFDYRSRYHSPATLRAFSTWYLQSSHVDHAPAETITNG